MITRLLVGFAIPSIVLGALFFTNTSAAASQTVSPTARASTMMPPRQLESPVERQMLALERHSKVNMILYSGRLGETAIASAPVMALTVAPVSR